MIDVSWKYRNRLRESFRPGDHIRLPGGMLARFALPGLFVLATASSLAAADIRARVLSISDGDSINVEHAGRRLRIRLLGIDAPEKGQPFAGEARKTLSELILKKNVRLVTHGAGSDSRLLAEVYIGRVAVHQEMLKRGLAWVYPAHRKNRTLVALESQARRAKIGIWSRPGAVSPWEYKERKRKQAEAEHDPNDGQDHTGHDHSGHEHTSDCDHAPPPKPKKKPEPGPPAGDGGCSIN